MNRRDGIILQKVLSEVNIAAGMMKGCSLTEFLDNEMLKRAVCMTVINVGELVKNLTEKCRLSHPEVAWKEIAGFRDIAAHKYQTLRMEDVYETAVTDFPDLQQKITRILAEQLTTSIQLRMEVSYPSPISSRIIRSDILMEPTSTSILNTNSPI